MRTRAALSFLDIAFAAWSAHHGRAWSAAAIALVGGALLMTVLIDWQERA